MRPLMAALLAALPAAAAVAGSSALAQRPAQPVPPGKPPPLGVPWDGRPDPAPADRLFGTGTAFVVADRKLLTNRHVVAPCSRLVARDAGGNGLPAKVEAADAGRDLALLSLDKDAGPPLVFRDSPAVRRGEAVVAYGFPLAGLLSSGPTLTTGTVNALTGLLDNPVNLQISAAVQPGNSGGPLFDGSGHVVGVVVAKLNAARVAQLTGGDIPQDVNFAVKGTEAVAFLRGAGIEPAVAASTGPERRPDEIDAIAAPSTLLLQCFR